MHLFYKRIFNIIICWTFLTFYHNRALAQGEGNIWYFGNNAGLDFNTSPPTPLLNGQMNTSEGCATICDASGSLLFYTDGISVWDNTHTQMPNGFGLLGDPSSAQSGVIIPQPGNDSIFYVFTTPSYQNASIGFCYSIVNMNLNGGLGDVIASSKNTLLFSPSSEKLAATYHCNHTDIWVVGRSNQDFYSYLITPSGISGTPVITSGITNPSLPYPYGMKCSPDGKKIVGSYYSANLSELYDFNINTGQLSNPITLPLSGQDYGAEFSPDATKLYISVCIPRQVIQYDLTAANIPASAINVGSTNGSYTGQLQLGTDGKIYIAEVGAGTLAVIHNPNVSGTGCNLQAGAINLGGRTCQYGLPTIMSSFFSPPPATDTVSICGSYTWYGTTYNTSGNYTDTLTSSTGCDSVVTLHLTITQPPTRDTTATACSSFTWHGTNYTQSGDYTDIISSCLGGIQALDGSNVYYKYATVYDWDNCYMGPNAVYESPYSYPVDGHWKIQYDCNGVGTVIESTGNYASYYPVGSIYTGTFGPSTNPTYLSLVTDANCANALGDKIYVELTEQNGTCDSIVTLHLTIQSCMGDCASFNDTLIRMVGNKLVQVNQNNTQTVDWLNITGLPAASVIDDYWKLTWHDGHQCFYVICRKAGGAVTATQKWVTLGKITLTGQFTLLGEINIPNNTIYHIEAIAYSYFDNNLYVGCSMDNNLSSESYVRVDIPTMTGTFINTVTSAQNDIDAMEFDLTGNLYYMDGVPPSNTYIYRRDVNFTTPAVQLIQFPYSATDDITIKGNSLYFVDGQMLRKLDLTTNIISNVGNMTAVPPLAFSGAFYGLTRTPVIPNFVSDTTVNVCGSSYSMNGNTYTTSGDYTDTLTNSNGCDSIVTLHLTITPFNVQTSNDTAICAGNSVPLNASGATHYRWLPATGLSDTAIANPTAMPTQTTTYTLTALQSSSQNLITNGDFENGNNGFSTGYLFSAPNPMQGPGHYTVAPSITNGWFANCADHTPTGANNMLLADGANGDDGVASGTTIWCQTVNVTPNTDYEFSTWLTNLNASGSTSQLGFSINGSAIGAIQNTPLGTCQWNEFYVLWNSGTNTTANVCIAEASGAQPGNDLAIDDISFVPLCRTTKTVTITVNNSVIKDTSITSCVSYNWNGNIYNTSNDYTDTLTTINGCDSIVTIHLTINQPNTGDTIATACESFNWHGISYNVTGDYTDTLINSGGCDSVVTLHLTINSISTGDTTASACVSFNWHSTTYTTTGNYNDTLINSNGCDSIVTLHLTIYTITTSDTTAASCLSFDWHSTVYNTSGDYNDTLTSSAGCDSIVTLHLTIVQPSVANFLVNDVCLGNAVVFNNNSTGTISSFSWNFGDGSPVDIVNQNPNHTYSSSGTFAITLITQSISASCADTLTDSVTVFDLPVADFSANEVCIGQSIDFIDNSTAPAGGTVVSWQWNFDDGTPDNTLQNTAHNYSNYGEYFVSLIVTTNNNCKDTITNSLVVHPLPNALFSYSTTCVGNSTVFTDESTVPVIVSNDVITSWIWDFDENGATSNTQSASYQYANTGTYSVQLNVVSDFGCADSVIIPVVVNPTPVADFTLSDTAGCSPFCFSFTDASSVASGTNTQWYWDLGDGATSTSAASEHCYDNPDITPIQFSISLTVVSDSGCTALVNKNNVITVYPMPVANFSASPQITTLNDPNVTFDNTSNSAALWFWDFGDGSSDIIQNPPTHTYSDTGTYNVSLIAATAFGCTDTSYSTVVIEPDFTIYIPNAFTPNDNDINETFIPKGSFVDDFQMKIFDRWGNLVFETNDIKVGWNGKTKKGTDALPDVYVYSIKCIDAQLKKHAYRGIVTLVR